MDRVIINISEKKYTPIDPTARWGVANMHWLNGWWNEPAYKDWSLFPMSAMKCDSGDARTRGRNIRVTVPMWNFVKKINDKAGFEYTRKVDMLIINREYYDEFGILHESPFNDGNNGGNAPDPYPLCEPIILPTNPVQIIDESDTHYRLAAFVHNKTNWNALDPDAWGWEHMPHLIQKCCAEGKDGRIYNVGRDVDAFWPILALDERGAWVRKEVIKLAPDPKDYEIDGSRGIGYRLHGAHWIMGLENGRQVYVRRVTKREGTIDYYGWKPNFRSVKPPAWFK